MELISTALVMAVDQYDFGPHLILLPVREVLGARKADQVLLEAVSCFDTDRVVVRP